MLFRSAVVEVDAPDVGVVTRVDRVFLFVDGLEEALQVRHRLGARAAVAIPVELVIFLTKSGAAQAR